MAKKLRGLGLVGLGVSFLLLSPMTASAEWTSCVLRLAPDSGATDLRLVLEPFEGRIRYDEIAYVFSQEVGFKGEFAGYRATANNHCDTFPDKAGAMAWSQQDWAAPSEIQRRHSWYPGKPSASAPAANAAATAKPAGPKAKPKSQPSLTVSNSEKPDAVAPTPGQASKPKATPKPTVAATTPKQCPMVPRKVTPVTAAFPSLAQAELNARAKVANACGAKGVASIDMANKCPEDVQEKVTILEGKVTGVKRTSSWMCMPVATCVDTVEKCGGSSNSPSAGSRQ